MEKFDGSLIWVKVINFTNQTLSHDDFQLACKTTGSLKKTCKTVAVSSHIYQFCGDFFKESREIAFQAA